VIVASERQLTGIVNLDDGFQAVGAGLNLSSFSRSERAFSS
jgi:hypothetical protein